MVGGNASARGSARPASLFGMRRSFALTAALPALTKNLAFELAPIRVNLIAAGFVDTPLSAAILGDQLDARRDPPRNAADRAYCHRTFDVGQVELNEKPPISAFAEPSDGLEPSTPSL
jgi:NAD(P)-dependent dehydrogenase (short-subunit alcohol dehydrogenase family)